jgi:hypothetical protein
MICTSCMSNYYLCDCFKKLHIIKKLEEGDKAGDNV